MSVLTGLARKRVWDGSWLFRHAITVPLLVLTVGLLATAAASYQLGRVIDLNDTQRFQQIAQQKLNAIEDRIENHIALLRGAAGLFAASEAVGRSGFAAYVERLNLEERYPGIQGIGFTQRIGPSQLDAFLNEVRERVAPDFRVWPPEPRPEYHAIVYLEPLDERNLAAIGFDMFTNPIRRQAMERARDTGLPAASGKVELVQEIDENRQAGFLIYLPVYQGGSVPETIEERRSQLRGFVYSPYRSGDLFAALSEMDVDPQLDFEVYDGTPEGENLLYDSSLVSDERADDSIARFRSAEPLEVAGRDWTVLLASGPAFEQGSGRELTPFVLAGGVLATLLLSALAWSQGLATRAALRAREELQQVNSGLEDRVVERTRELRSVQSELRHMNANLEATVAERTADLSAANEEIQRFAYIVGHDLRAPLVNVMGFTSELQATNEVLKQQQAILAERAPELALAEAKDAVELDLPEAIDFIRASTAKMDRLINAILRLSREGRRVLTPEPVAMKVIAQGIADSLRHQTEAVGAEIVVADDLPGLVTDRLAIEQAFGNLIENAVKYLDTERPGRIAVRGREDGTFVEYEIEDNGRGIEPKDHERVFELFRRAGIQDKVGEGLGLSFVQTIVRRLGGSVALASEPGRGSTFSLRFPKVLNLQAEERS